MKKIDMIEIMVKDWCKVITDNYVDYMCLKEQLTRKIDRSWAKEMIVDTYNKYVIGKLKIGQVMDRLGV
jgi:hypothetical protein